jgi:hypothetical protein
MQPTALRRSKGVYANHACARVTHLVTFQAVAVLHICHVSGSGDVIHSNIETLRHLGAFVDLRVSMQACAKVICIVTL